jgi:nucleoside-diphosphate-sugar epimerase
VLVSSRSEIDDIAKEGVFDSAVKGNVLSCMSIIFAMNMLIIFWVASLDDETIPHVASPVIFNAEHPVRDVIEPAVKGTLSQLNSAQRHGKNVKSIVVTSSIASVLNSQVEAGHVYTESDWNDGAYQAALQLKENGVVIDGMLAYAASKKEAEHAMTIQARRKRLISVFPQFYLDTSTAPLFLLQNR